MGIGSWLSRHIGRGLVARFVTVELLVALVCGLVNAAVALWSTILFRRQLGAPRLLVGACVIVLGLLGAGMAGANRITDLTEDNLSAADVILAKSSRYQRIVLTAWKNDLRLFLNGHLQFSSRDEYRYHEALVHPGLAAVPGARRILILGGGDGLAAREVLRYPGVESVTLVDLDPVMTQLFATHPVLTPLNARALTPPKLHIVNADAFVWLETPDDPYDFVIVDFPDPSSYHLGKLYTTAFYRLAAKHLQRGGF